MGSVILLGHPVKRMHEAILQFSSQMWGCIPKAVHGGALAFGLITHWCHPHPLL